MNINQFEYFFVLALSGFFPFLFILFHPAMALFRSRFRTIFTGIVSIACVWILADMWQTNRGWWGFNYNYVTGFFIGNLPIEEWLFFIVIPLCCLFVWTVIKDFTTWPNFFKQLFNK